ncbi:MAG: hypothetical protein L0229_06115, partial [Blastocatellia bacterium]|nr:hypothetical protein [Blastocatellia bacterium]
TFTNRFTAIGRIRGVESFENGDNKILERAKRLLICEIAEVMRETEKEAEERIDQALKAGKEERKSVLITGKDSIPDSNHNGDGKEVSG